MDAFAMVKNEVAPAKPDAENEIHVEQSEEIEPMDTGNLEPVDKM